jgi:hypothetical protein
MTQLMEQGSEQIAKKRPTVSVSTEKPSEKRPRQQSKALESAVSDMSRHCLSPLFMAAERR